MKIPASADFVMFKAEQVRSLLARRKTVTRRLVKPQPANRFGLGRIPKKWHPLSILYVREALTMGSSGPVYSADETVCVVGDPSWVDGRVEGSTCPALFAPKWSSRILLLVENTRAELLQDMEESDATLEGLEDQGDPQVNLFAYTILWDEINGRRAPWVSNPWVYRIQFKILEIGQ